MFSTECDEVVTCIFLKQILQSTKMFCKSLRSFGKVVQIQRSSLCTGAKPRYQKPVGRNVGLAVALLTFVGGVYYTAINKMRQVTFCKKMISSYMSNID